MKKSILTLLFLLLAAAGWSQISKTDVAAFLTRNPFTPESEFQVDDDAFEASEIVSLKQGDSGFLLTIKDTEGNQLENFYAYARVANMYTWCYEGSKVKNLKINTH